MNAKIAEIMKNEEVVMKLDGAETEEAFCKILIENGASAEDINEFIEYMSKANSEGELSEDQLDSVAGGGPVIQKILAKWAYRLQHGKFFVKVSVKGDYIIVTNRFGEKVSESYLY